MSRPETTAPPEIFYNDEEAKKYTTSTRVQHIQREMTLRALELLNPLPSQHILDIGCGSGLSGEILTEEGHTWVGMDISVSMLANALDREVEGDMFLADIGNGIPFRAGSFDCAISISVVQWLCNADTTNSNPELRLHHFFETLYAALVRGGKAVMQFYPNDNKQTDMILKAAKTAGFAGGMVVDDPESKKKKKCYLVLTAGISGQGLNLEGVSADNIMKSKKKSRNDETRKEYIMRKKEIMRKRGKLVALDSKFTARKRRPKF
jgi:18S rRNA (guanine1575-N7)-methyltransferase